MESIATSVNGIHPIITPPPPDVPPTIPDYGTTIGVTELTGPDTAIPAALLAEGLVTFPVVYQFEEYALMLQGGQLTQVPLPGMTINWAASQLSQSGTLNLQFGVSIFYRLIGKQYAAHQYTYLSFNCVLTENGHQKPASWTIRMKHF